MLRLSANIIGSILLALAFTTSVHAIEKIEAKKWYLVQGTGWHASGQQAADAWAKQFCSENVNLQSCTQTYSHDMWLANGRYWVGHGQFTKTFKENGGTVTGEANNRIDFGCPDGWTSEYDSTGGWCSRPDQTIPPCEECDARKAGRVGNPIAVNGGVKVQTEIDYQNASGTLKFVRSYRSDEGVWRHNYQYFGIDFNNTSSAVMPDHAAVCGKDNHDGKVYCYAQLGNGNVRNFGVRRGAGRVIYFGNNTDWAPAKDINDRAIPDLDASGHALSWQVINSADDSVELYSRSGHLQSITQRNGQVTTFSYSTTETPMAIAPRPGLLLKVEDAFGQSLQFTYDDTGRMAAMVDPAGNITSYQYDASGLVGKVTYPDGKSKIYVYDELDKTANVAQGGLLTGIIDENNVRYATFTYGAWRIAKSTEHAGGVEKYSLVYPDRYTTEVTDPLGSFYRYSHAEVQGVWRQRRVDRPSATGTETVYSRTDYDYGTGNINTYYDFDWTPTTYSYDLARNLETKRVEAYGKPVARTIHTEWHSKYRVPVRISEPLRRTTFTHDDAGNILSKTVQATTDANGAQGFAATLAGTPSTWTYTYSPLGQLLTEKDPRTDVNSTTTYTYDAHGNLETITNAANHVTTLSNYDAHGHVGRITDPNGLVTDVGYTPRGWISSITVGGEATSFDYDNAGQRTRTTLPDGSSLTYIYDPAHRLTDIQDSFGNSTHYTLDNQGNRIKEETKDPNGTLAKQVSRIIDNLGRVKQVTGAAQ